MANAKISELPVLQKMGNTGAAPSAARNWDFAYTWTGGSTWVGDYLNITDTSSAAASLFFDRQVGGVSKWSVRKDGQTIVGTDGTGSAVMFGRQANTGIFFPGTNQTGISANGATCIFNGVALYCSDSSGGALGTSGVPFGRMYIAYTNTGTVGAVTINKAAGRVNIAAAGTSVVVTNSYVTAASKVFVVCSTNDTTARVSSVVPAAGSFTINTPACTAQTSFDFFVVNSD
jgi:hypothetical protein